MDDFNFEEESPAKGFGSADAGTIPRETAEGADTSKVSNQNKTNSLDSLKSNDSRIKSSNPSVRLLSKTETNPVDFYAVQNQKTSLNRQNVERSDRETYQSNENLNDSNMNESISNKLVSARGTGNGLTIVIDGRHDFLTLKSDLTVFLDARSSFIRGNEVALEWLHVEPSQRTLENVKDFLQNNYKVNVSSTKTSNSRNRSDFSQDPKSLSNYDNGKSVSSNANSGLTQRLGLFGGIESLDVDPTELKRKTTVRDNQYLREEDNEQSHLAYLESAEVDSISAWDDPDARIVWGTLRSGQKIESDHSLVIVGDVNSGAEVVAGGDIIVLGKLRGVAHAGAYDETGGGRFIFALNLLPTQLRIGMVISRGSAEAVSNEGSNPEIAYIDGSNISVENYNSRTLPKRVRG